MSTATSIGRALPADTGRPSHDLVMREEAGRILDHPSFRNAPILSKLLKFLVEETVAGRGNALKGYSVAVEGLGRPEDFDSHADSYPRVQVGRLRRALEAYYAQHAPGAGLCLFLQPGSYRLRLGSLGTAYPNLYRPLSAASAPEKLPVGEPASGPPPLDPGARRDRTGLWERPSLWIALLLLTIAMGFYIWRWEAGKHADPVSLPSAAQSPIVYVQPLAQGPGDVAGTQAEDAYAMLVDGISRSWVARVRLGPVDENALSSTGPADTYRIEAQLSGRAGGPSRIFVRLADARTGTLLWSTTKMVTSPDGKIDAELGALISQISGPYGVIASAETRRFKDSFAPGYACMLQYLSFLASRNPEVQPKVGECLLRPSAELDLEATRYAFLSSYLLEAENVGLGRTEAFALAQRFAELAVGADPDQGYAQFARARAAFVRGDCAAGQRSARLAAAASPFDPIILAVLGGLLNNCGYDEGTAMLERAFRYKGPGESYARLSLILSAIRENRLDRLKALTEVVRPRFGSGVSYHYLSETLIHAAQGNIEAAQADWLKFTESSHTAGQSIDRSLATVILVPTLRLRVANYLAGKGVIAGVTPQGNANPPSEVTERYGKAVTVTR